MENLNLEESPVKKFATKYDFLLISKCGKVFSKDRIKHSFARNRTPYSCKINGKELKLRKDKDGYLRFNIVENGKHITILVHRLMAETFLGNRPNNFVIDHIDRNNNNNQIENLRYISQMENVRNSNFHKMTDEKKQKAMQMKNIGLSIAAIARALNVQHGSIKYYFSKI